MIHVIQLVYLVHIWILFLKDVLIVYQYVIHVLMLLIVLLVRLGIFCLIGFVIILVPLFLLCIISIMGFVLLVSRSVLHVQVRLLRVVHVLILATCIILSPNSVHFSAYLHIFRMRLLVLHVSRHASPVILLLILAIAVRLGCMYSMVHA